MEEDNNLPAVPAQPSSRSGNSQIELLKQATTVSKAISLSNEEEISQALRYVMGLLGLRIVDGNDVDLPTPAEKAIMMDYLYDECHKNTPEEIKLAFKWGLAGKTGLKQEDTQLYGKRFSAAFISIFMNAFNKYKKALHENNKNKPDPNQKRLAEPKENPEDKAKVDAIIQQIKDRLKSPTSEDKLAVRPSSQVITQQMFHTELVNTIKELDMETLQSLIRDSVKYNDVKALRLIEAEIDLRNTK